MREDFISYLETINNDTKPLNYNDMQIEISGLISQIKNTKLKKNVQDKFGKLKKDIKDAEKISKQIKNKYDVLKQIINYQKPDNYKEFVLKYINNLETIDKDFLEKILSKKEIDYIFDMNVMNFAIQSKINELYGDEFEEMDEDEQEELTSELEANYLDGENSFENNIYDRFEEILDKNNSWEKVYNKLSKLK